MRSPASTTSALVLQFLLRLLLASFQCILRTHGAASYVDQQRLVHAPRVNTPPRSIHLLACELEIWPFTKVVARNAVSYAEQCCIEVALLQLLRYDIVRSLIEIAHEEARNCCGFREIIETRRDMIEEPIKRRP